MGGKAIEGAKSLRIPRSVYEPLAARCAAAAAEATGSLRCEPVRALKGKEDFGDLDLLLSAEGMRSDWAQSALAAFGSEQWRQDENSPVLSMLVDGFQVDLMRAAEGSFDFARGYFAWNDLGNLMGKTAKRWGFKLGSDGFFYRRQASPSRLEDVLVTRDWGQALDFLGFDPARHEEGFADASEMFAYAASSRLFDPQAFIPERLNSKDRRRDMARPNYRAFLAQLGSMPAGAAAGASLQDVLRAAMERFASLGPDLEALALADEQRARRSLAARALMPSQDFLRQASGLSGRELGVLAEAFREELLGSGAGSEAEARELFEAFAKARQAGPGA